MIGRQAYRGVWTRIGLQKNRLRAFARTAVKTDARAKPDASAKH
jgi:hypothetical protein